MDALGAAVDLIVDRDPAFVAIVSLSLSITLTALVLATVIAVPVGTWLGLSRFRFRSVVIVLVNALMGLPPVVAGLIVYLILSRSGPLGSLGWLFTPTAMIIAQTILIVPIILSLTRATTEDLWLEYREHLTSLGLTGWRAVPTLMWDGRFALTTALLAGFGRASAEVGAVLIVGGNVAGYTRTMTTTIALEISKGDLALALGLGIVLIGLTILLTAGGYAAGRLGARYAG